MSDTIITVPLSKLVASSRNVRRSGAEAGLDELAASIVAHGLLQSLVVVPQEGGRFEVLAGGRRLVALQALARQKRIAKSYPVPVIVRADADEETSLAENVVRVALHPADQFETFRRLAETGASAEAIADRFGCSERLVRQRLALGAVSPKLIDLYREGTLTLAQLEAFTVTSDHARQEAAWASLSWNKDAPSIRRALMQAAVSGRDRRVQLVGLQTYEREGGIVARDLFSSADECWLEDVALLDRLAREALVLAATEVRTEGWRWVEVALDLPYAHGFRRAYPEPVALSPDQEVRRVAFAESLERIDAEHPDGLPYELAQQVGGLEQELAILEAKMSAYPSDVIARAGVFVALGQDGTPRIERGFVRPEDELAVPAEQMGEDAGPEQHGSDGVDTAETEEDDGRPALSDRLTADLTAHRSMALRDALGEAPDVALLALTHALVAQAFLASRFDRASPLLVRLDTATLSHYAPDLDEGRASRAVEARHAAWARQVPRDPDALWTWLAGLDRDSRDALLAHVVGRSVVAVALRFGHTTAALDTADRIAAALELDLARSWQATAGFLGRVSKAFIVEAVREAVSNEAAGRLAGLRKTEMIAEAETLLAGTGWLPGPLRTPSSREADAEPSSHAVAAE